MRQKLGFFATVTRGTADRCAHGAGLYTASGQPVFDVQGEITDWGSGLIDMGVEVGMTTFPYPGTYYLRVFVPGELLAERPFVVAVARPGPPSEEQQG